MAGHSIVFFWASEAPRARVSVVLVGSDVHRVAVCEGLGEYVAQ